MCVLVGRPPLLNEVWSGIDDSVDLAARAHLRAGRVGPEQAVVVATQLPDEAPAWGEKDSIVRVLFEDGECRSITDRMRGKPKKSNMSYMPI